MNKSIISERLTDILCEPTDLVVEGCINSLRLSMKSLAHLHIQEGDVFKSPELSRKTKRLLRLLALFIKRLIKFKDTFKEVKNGRT
jgi:hypothetical protein